MVKQTLIHNVHRNVLKTVYPEVILLDTSSLIWQQSHEPPLQSQKVTLGIKKTNGIRVSLV